MQEFSRTWKTLGWFSCTKNLHPRCLRPFSRGEFRSQTNVRSDPKLLEKDNSVTVHVKNLQVLVTEMYKVQNNCSSEIMNKVFPINEPIY